MVYVSTERTGSQFTTSARKYSFSYAATTEPAVEGSRSVGHSTSRSCVTGHSAGTASTSGSGAESRSASDASAAVPDSRSRVPSDSSTPSVSIQPASDAAPRLARIVRRVHPDCILVRYFTISNVLWCGIGPKIPSQRSRAGRKPRLARATQTTNGRVVGSMCGYCHLCQRLQTSSIAFAKRPTERR